MVKGFGKAVDAVERFVAALKPKTLDDYIIKLKELGIAGEEIFMLEAQTEIVRMTNERLDASKKISQSLLNETEAHKLVEKTQKEIVESSSQLAYWSSEKNKTEREYQDLLIKEKSFLELSTKMGEKYADSRIQLTDTEQERFKVLFKQRKEYDENIKTNTKIFDTAKDISQEAREYLGALKTIEVKTKQISEYEKLILEGYKEKKAVSKPTPPSEVDLRAIAAESKLIAERELFEFEFQQEQLQRIRDAGIASGQKYYDEQRSAREDNLKTIKAAQDEEKRLLEAHAEHIARIQSEIGLNFSVAMGQAIEAGRPVLKAAMKGLLQDTIEYIQREILLMKLIAAIRAVKTLGVSALADVGGIIAVMAMLEVAKASVANYQHGIGFVSQSQPAIIHQGERVMSATENRGVIDALGRIESKLGQDMSGGNTYNVNAIDASTFREYMRRTGYAIMEEDASRGRLVL